MCGDKIIELRMQDLKIIYLVLYWIFYLVLLTYRAVALIVLGLFLLCLLVYIPIELYVVKPVMDSLSGVINTVGSILWDSIYLNLVWLHLAIYELLYWATGWVIETYWGIELALWGIYWFFVDTIWLILEPIVSFTWWLITYIPNLTDNWGWKFLV